jgi:hypothetical protein
MTVLFTYINFTRRLHFAAPETRQRAEAKDRCQ